jgi:hypothetical protein
VRTGRNGAKQSARERGRSAGRWASTQHMARGAAGPATAAADPRRARAPARRARCACP